MLTTSDCTHWMGLVPIAVEWTPCTLVHLRWCTTGWAGRLRRMRFLAVVTPVSSSVPSTRTQWLVCFLFTNNFRPIDSWSFRPTPWSHSLNLTLPTQFHVPCLYKFYRKYVSCYIGDLVMYISRGGFPNHTPRIWRWEDVLGRWDKFLFVYLYILSVLKVYTFSI